MANWISSKLKVAETFFEQIDQQAADSLKKSERPRSDGQKFDHPTKLEGSVSLKDQLKKKTLDTNYNSPEYHGKLQTDPTLNNASNGNILNYTTSIKTTSPVSNSKSNSNISNGEKNISTSPKPSPKPKIKKPTLTDSDWTELLGTPTQLKTLRAWSSNGASTIRGSTKEGRRQGSLGMHLSVPKNQKISNKSSNMDSRSKLTKMLDSGLGNNLNGKPSDREQSSSSARSSSVELQSDGKIFIGQELEDTEMDVSSVGKQKTQRSKENGADTKYWGMSGEDLWSAGNKKTDAKKGVGDVYKKLRSTVKVKSRSVAASKSSVSIDLKKGTTSTSDEGSDSHSDSRSSSDSESEGETDRRENILAVKAAAKAVEVIKEQENVVAKLEGEKQSFEKILEERAKQQAQEAAELQTTMMETMDAVELEKQKHNSTRMEALTRLAKLETANADLARSLASAQKNLEVELNRVVELRQQFEMREVALEEVKRKKSKSHRTGTYLNQLAASKEVEFGKEIFEAEHLILADKIGRLEDKAKKLEANIEMTRKEMDDPTEVEMELKQRLDQLTDHLIQKQTQVEELSSEKATLLLRIEAVSRLLEENKPTMNTRDVEFGTWEITDSKFRPQFEDKIRSGRKHLGSLLQQLDALFLAGAVFLRRNPAAKLWSLVYLASLHLWVIYILMSHSQASEGRSGAVYSLENINKTAGI